MKRYTITTLGCKVNQCESAALEQLLETSGYGKGRSAGTKDLIVVNTCTVTGKAAMQSRQAIRQAIRNHPEAKIVVTGCYAQTAPDEIKSIPDVDLIIGHGDKLKLTQLLDKIGAHSKNAPALVHRPTGQLNQFSALPSVAPERRTRAFLKIQDGCNAFCTYCIVPHARGRSRSMPADDVMAHLEKLAEKNFLETVLTGIHLGAYGQDFKPQTSLAQLLKAIADGRTMERIRISSIEPTEVDASLIDLMADSRSPVCPHFHIPLQSGDDAVLKRMGRPYDGTKFSQVIQSINTAMPHAAIGVDVLAGFPGESEQAFDNTYGLIESLPVSYLHVFPFSARKGTPAAKFKDKVPDRVIKERCKHLRRLGEKKRADFYAVNIGQHVNVLIETLKDSRRGHPKGISENYIPVILPNAPVTENSIISVRIEQVDSDQTVLGNVVGS